MRTDGIIFKVYDRLPFFMRKIIQRTFEYLYNLRKTLRFHWSWAFRKEKPISIMDFEHKVYSQNGEDGVIQAILYKIKPTNRFCVEFGVQDGTECNTRLLKEKGWKVLMMDGNDDNPRYIKQEYITAENINTIFKKYKVPREFDVLSIDIDSNDLWVWKAIKGYSPRVVVIEYNSAFPPPQSKTVKYDPKLTWQKTNYFGASIAALHKLGKEKGYTLVGCESTGLNAFFVRDDLVDGNFVVKPLKEAYVPPRYGIRKKGRFIGHVPDKRKMVTY